MGDLANHSGAVARASRVLLTKRRGVQARRIEKEISGLSGPTDSQYNEVESVREMKMTR